MAQAEIEHSLTAPIVEINGLSFAFKRDEPVLRGINLEITEGSIVMIIGRSGSGKTTLLKLITGLLPPAQGEIRLFGQQRQWRRQSCDPRIAYIPQQLGLVRSLSVKDNVLMGALSGVNTLPSLLHIFRVNLQSQAQEILEELGIAHKTQEKVYYLSGGERQRVAIARALMQQAKLILADEFVSQLDQVTTPEIMEIVRKIAQKGVTFIITTHELSLLRYAQRVIILRNGQKVWEATAEQIPDDQQIKDLMK